MRPRVILTMSLLATIIILSQSHETIPTEPFSLTILNCSMTNCTAAYVQLINQSSQSRCAYYSLTDPTLIKLLEEKHTSLILNREKPIHQDLTIINTRHAKRGSMHSKYCILTINKTPVIITGSYNPTSRLTGDLLLIITNSSIITNAYQQEWDEYAQGIYGGGIRNNACVTNTTTILCALFCPEDHCAERIISTLQTARRIHVSAYVFTHPKLAGFLIQKHQEGANVSITLSKHGWNSPGSQAERFHQAGIPISRADTPYSYHYKLWQAENATHRILITGSMNPTINGDRYNDETLVMIIEEKE